MNDLRLSHAELLAALDIMGASALVSIPAARLFPPGQEQREEIMRGGRDSLKQRGLLKRGRNDHITLDAALAGLIATVAFPRIAILQLHNDRDAGLRRHWFYQWDGHVVEHTIDDGQHHFRELEDLAALVERMSAICALRSLAPSDMRLEMAQDAFYTVKGLASRHAHEEARDVMHNAGLTNAAGEAFLHTLEEPIAVDNIAFLRCTKEAVIDGRNLALMQGEQAAWTARQQTPGVPKLLIEATGAELIKKQMLSCFAELARA